MLSGRGRDRRLRAGDRRRRACRSGCLGSLAPSTRVLTRWLEQGARYEGPPPLPAATVAARRDWERFFNGDSLKAQLFSRYAYEHLFLAHLYFDDRPERRFFKLVRSATPPGQPVKIIASRRPVDDPGVARVYYRLAGSARRSSPRRTCPMRSNAARMARWRELFFDPPYAVDRLPGYDDADTAANPFLTFAALPVQARYRFMLDEAAVHDHGLHQGTGVPRPDGARRDRGPLLGDFPRAVRRVRQRRWRRCCSATTTCCACRPAAATRGILIPWLHYARLENEYLQAKTEVRRRALQAARAPARPGPDLGRRRPQRERRADDLSPLRQRQRGQGDGRRAAQDRLGHRLSAARANPLPAGGRLRRLRQRRPPAQHPPLHGLPAHGRASSISWRCLPQSQRIATRDFWYRGTGEAGREQVYGGPATTLDVESKHRLRAGDPKNELLALMKARLAPVLNTSFELSTVPIRRCGRDAGVAGVGAASLQWLPEAASWWSRR